MQTLDDLIREFAKYPTSVISDNQDRLVGAKGIAPYSTSPNFAGRAFTVRARPGDNLYVHLALDLASPGDVLVVDAGGETTNAIVGEIMKTYAESRGILAFIIDGAIRDVDAMRVGSLKCFARGVTNRGPSKNGPGAVRVPVQVGGMIVNQGDIVVGDADGVIAIAPASAPELLSKVKESLEIEKKIFEDIKSNRFDRSWLAPLIAKHRA